MHERGPGAGKIQKKNFEASASVGQKFRDLNPECIRDLDQAPQGWVAVACFDASQVSPM